MFERTFKKTVCSVAVSMGDIWVMGLMGLMDPVIDTFVA